MKTIDHWMDRKTRGSSLNHSGVELTRLSFFSSLQQSFNMLSTNLLLFYISLGSSSIFILSFNLYPSSHNHDDICVLSIVRSEYRKHFNAFDLTSLYCVRNAEVLRLIVDDDFQDPSDHVQTFAELQKTNTTVEDLLSMSATIEQAELYQMYLDDLSSTKLKSNVFTQCTSLWFGRDCRFRRPSLLMGESFDAVIDHFRTEQERLKNIIPICYVHLQCERPGGMCLDWRHICDSKADCADGSDEMHCWMLEINECADNEFRCRNGQCISGDFFNDNPGKPDCLDGSDEKGLPLPREACWFNRGLRCENLQCRRVLVDEPCGNENCRVAGSAPCAHNPHNDIPKDACSTALDCLLNTTLTSQSHERNSYCRNNDPLRLKQKNCPSWIQYPPVPVLFDHVRLIFTNATVQPDYICFDVKRCPNISSDLVHFRNFTCVHHPTFALKKSATYEELVNEIKGRFLECSTVFYEGKHCNRKVMYRCRNSSKCVSKHRLMDGVQDCRFNDDEELTVDELAWYSLPEKRPFVFPTTSNEDDPQTRQEDQLNFAEICDGIDHWSPVLIDGRNETDETNCDGWPCNRTYTRCDNRWHCDNGADEVDCGTSTCPPLHHPCIFFNQTTNISCLSIDRAADDIIDCIGGYDEPKHCETWNKSDPMPWCFTCRETNRSLPYLDVCNRKADCPLKDDELFCRYVRVPLAVYPFTSWASTNVEKLIEEKLRRRDHQFKYFRLGDIRTRISQTISNLSVPDVVKVPKISPISVRNPGIGVNDGLTFCYQGVPLQIRLKNQTMISTCLCPPTQYGDRCQYQNQRVSLTIKINATSKWTPLFTLVVILIDEEHHIESYERIEHVTLASCMREYDRDLIYATRRTNMPKTYSIRIDAFDKVSGQYQASWIFPILFPFLPVYRLPVQLVMHHLVMKHSSQCVPSCLHGQCLRYYNAPHLSFCRCDAAWSGKRCDKPIRCQCAIHAYCYSDSICLCPANRFGPRCYLKVKPLKTKYCQNGGQEIFTENYFYTRSEKYLFCLCPREFHGIICQSRRSLLQIGFHPSIPVPSYLWIHWVQVKSHFLNSWSQPHKIPIHQNTLSLHSTDEFHLAFAQISSTYYLIFNQETVSFPVTIETQIHPSHRCSPLDKVFNRTMTDLHLLKRMKNYHIPCRQNPALVCFHDSSQFCLCERDGMSNCFRFAHGLNFDCSAKDLCANGAQCVIERDQLCPSWTECLCQDCYFGSRCQFSTRDTLPSLDKILGYHLNPRLSIAEQSKIVKVSIALVTTLLVVSFFNNIGSLWTFQTRATLDLDGGRYLLAATITSLVLTAFLVIKFWLYIVWQLGFIVHRPFINRQCLMTSFILQVLIRSIDWFFALAAIERMFTVIRGIYFDKMKGQRIAKQMIIIVYLLTSLTQLHDPLHRAVVNDEREGQTWCVADYSENLRRYDRGITLFHFFVPFVINLVSPLIILSWVIYHQWNMRRYMSLTETIRIQYRIHRHRLLPPLTLLIISLCRMFLTLFVPCMRTAREAWFYLFAYFLPLMPATWIFVIFVLPSSLYRKEMVKCIKNACNR